MPVIPTGSASAIFGPRSQSTPNQELGETAQRHNLLKCTVLIPATSHPSVCMTNVAIVLPTYLPTAKNTIFDQPMVPFFPSWAQAKRIAFRKAKELNNLPINDLDFVSAIRSFKFRGEENFKGFASEASYMAGNG